MSEDRKPALDWLIAGSAIASLTAISPPAAGAAAIALGLHQTYEWFRASADDDEGPDKAE